MPNRTQVVAGLALGLLWAAAPVVAQSGSKVGVAGFETDGSVGLSREDYDALGRALSALLSAEVGSRGSPTSALVVKPVPDSPMKYSTPFSTPSPS